MLEKQDIHSLLHNPLSENTRKKKSMLLIVSFVGIAITKAGLIPKEIKALGIDFASSDQKSLYILVLAVVIYFIFAFSIYCVADFLIPLQSIYNEARQRMIQRGRHAYEEERRQGYTDIELVDMEAEHKFENSLVPIEKIATNEFPLLIIIFRMLLDFVLPIGVGIYSACLLVAISLAHSTTAQ